MFWLLGYGGMNDREAGSDSMFNSHHTYIQANLPNTHATPTYYKSIPTANINLILDILIWMIIQKKYFSLYSLSYHLYSLSHPHLVIPSN